MTDTELLSFLESNTRYEDGSLYWTTTNVGRKTGDVAGHKKSNGYVDISISGKPYKAHRLIFLLHFKKVPLNVDHMNGNNSDNRIENLRECNRFENMKNAKLRADNKAGIKGIHYNSRNKLWVAQLGGDGKRWKKEFKHLNDAVEMLNQKRAELHKEFARFA